MQFLAILLEWLSFISSADDFKAVIGALASLFGLSKVWDLWQKRNDNATKVEEAKINAEKEIQNNKDKHNAEIDKLNKQIEFQKGEIVFKDNLMDGLKREVEELKRALDEERREHKRNKADLIKINEEKDKEIRVMHERLLECEKSKKK